MLWPVVAVVYVLEWHAELYDDVTTVASVEFSPVPELLPCSDQFEADALVPPLPEPIGPLADSVSSPDPLDDSLKVKLLIVCVFASVVEIDETVVLPDVAVACALWLDETEPVTFPGVPEVEPDSTLGPDSE